MKIYELVHMHGAETLADGRFHYGDCAMLGCFSSAERVAAAIEKYRSIPGFCDYPNGFVVFAHEVEEHAVIFLQWMNERMFLLRYLRGYQCYLIEIFLFAGMLEK